VWVPQIGTFELALLRRSLADIYLSRLLVTAKLLLCIFRCIYRIFIALLPSVLVAAFSGYHR